MKKKPVAVQVTIRPAPRFSGGGGKPSLTTIYSSHFRRLEAVVDAARSKNDLLLKWALRYQDQHGCDDEDPHTS